jgi:peptidoglycan/xylan/chitin deacetylase (PgdA/CDA1 family)
MCEIGAHLHPWVTPPVEEDIHEHNTHAVNLPTDLVRRKIRNLTHKLEEEFGERPLTFRSGRWGVNEVLLKMLLEEGYQTDSSIHPFYADSIFSYYHAPETPYWPDLSDCIQKGTQREIFEIPVTSGFNRPYFRMCHNIHHVCSAKPWNIFHGIGILWHLNIMRKLQLSPELADASNMIALMDACLKRGHRIIHMFFHSSSLLPGGSPYVSNEDDEHAFYRKIADVITYLKTHVEVEFCTLTEARQHYLQEENT